MVGAPIYGTIIQAFVKGNLLIGNVKKIWEVIKMTRLLILILSGALVLAVLLGGCAPSICDRSSRNYEPRACQAFLQEMRMQQQQINQWSQQRQFQGQLQDLEMEQWRMRSTMDRHGVR